MTYNGEIYNYLELRDELEARGRTFRSTGDTEVLLAAYLEWGTEALARLDGMWAFAIYDARADALLLSRDRFGEKPLYWTRWSGGLAFASEVKQLLRFPGVVARLDAGRAAGFLATGRPYLGPSSWFEGIHQLEPGTWLRADASGIRRGVYYDIQADVAAVVPSRSPAEWTARFGEALSASIRRRLRSDVPVGTSLSAGIDSSMILAEATAQGHRAYQTFTLGSSDPRVDESGGAGSFAAAEGSTWHRVPADGREFAGLWDRMTWHQECPVPSTSLYGQWKVFETARANGVIVVLDGQGSDEILGGYNKFVASLLWRGTRGDPRRLVGPLRGFARQVRSLENLRTAGYRYLGLVGRGGAGGLRPDRWLRPGLFDGPVRPDIRTGTLDQRLDDIGRWSLPNLLAYADRNAMAHSVETRLPYLDPTVVALALAMPDDVLFRDGWTKWPLRVSLAARAGRVPAWVPGKRWFGVPQAAWLRTSLRSHVAEWLRAPHPAWAMVVDRRALARLQAHWRTASPSFALDDEVFQMVSLDRFFRTWFPDGTRGPVRPS
jgi:asparagine synthase (glutamine-hydrolysing)